MVNPGQAALAAAPWPVHERTFYFSVSQPYRPPFPGAPGGPNNGHANGNGQVNNDGNNNAIPPNNGHPGQPPQHAANLMNGQRGPWSRVHVRARPLTPVAVYSGREVFPDLRPINLPPPPPIPGQEYRFYCYPGVTNPGVVGLPPVIFAVRPFVFRDLRLVWRPIDRWNLEIELDNPEIPLRPGPRSNYWY